MIFPACGPKPALKSAIDSQNKWPIAMYGAFARGKPLHYAAIEIATLGTFAAITLTLMRLSDPAAPQRGYCAAYALTALIVSAGFLRSSRSSEAASTVVTA